MSGNIGLEENSPIEEGEIEIKPKVLVKSLSGEKDCEDQNFEEQVQTSQAPPMNLKQIYQS